MPTLARVLQLVSIGPLPWSFAVIFLIVGVIRYRMSKAKPEIILVVLSFVTMIAIGVISHSDSCKGQTTMVRSGDIDQSGNQNVAGVAGTVTQTAPQCVPQESKK